MLTKPKKDRSVSEKPIAALMADADLPRASELLVEGAVAAAGAAAGELLIGAAMKFWDETLGPEESLRLAHRTLSAIAAAIEKPSQLN